MKAYLAQSKAEIKLAFRQVEHRIVMIRFTNSIIGWILSAAMNCVPWQVGQSGQPRPDWLNLTAPPVTIITERRIKVAKAKV